MKRIVVPLTPALDTSHIVLDTERAGEMVSVKGEHGVFRIKCTAVNTKTGAEWVELWDKERAFRAVRPDRVVNARKRRAV